MKNNKTFINKHLQADDAANNRASSNIGSNQNREHSGATEERQADFIQYKMLASQHQLDCFSGTGSKRDAETWLERLLVYEKEWSSEKLLKFTKSLLTRSAKTWFMALLDEEIQCFDDFKYYFKKKYTREDKEEDNFLKICELLATGPMNISLENYIYMLKEKNKRTKIEIQTILKGISRHVPDRDKQHIIAAENLLDAIEIINKIFE